MVFAVWVPGCLQGDAGVFCGWCGPEFGGDFFGFFVGGDFTGFLKQIRLRGIWAASVGVCKQPLIIYMVLRGY